MWVLMSASPERSSKAHGAGDAVSLPDLQIRRFASYLREHGFLIGLGVILSQFADHFRQKLLQPSTVAEASEASKKPEKPVLNASILLWASAKKLLSSLWGKSDSLSTDDNHRKSSIWSWLYRK